MVKMDGDSGTDDVEVDAEPGASGGGEEAGGGGGGGGGCGGGDVEQFDFDVALLFSRKSEKDEDTAERLVSEMQKVELHNHRQLRVCLYSHPTFGASIIERPGNVLRRCRFVFVLVTENTQVDKETTYTKNETLGRILAAEKEDRRHCVRPLLLQREAPTALPDGLADHDRVYWLEGARDKCAANLALLVQDSIDNGNQSSKRGPSAAPPAQEKSKASTTDSSSPGADISFKAKESGSIFEVKIKGTVNAMMVGEHQHMTVNMPVSRKSNTKSKKKNKHTVTDCSLVPDREAMERVASEIGSAWRKLGRRLGLSDGEIETVQLDYQVEGQEEVVYQMLRKWITSASSPPASLTLLAHACVGLGRGDLADTLSLLPMARGSNS